MFLGQKLIFFDFLPLIYVKPGQELRKWVLWTQLPTTRFLFSNSPYPASGTRVSRTRG